MFSPPVKGLSRQTKAARKPMTPTRQNVNGGLYNYAESKDTSSMGAFGDLLMSAAKDADEERDEIHARRVAKQQAASAEKKRCAAEEEGRRLAEAVEEEENDKLLAARLLQEEREYEELEEMKKQRQAEKDAEHARVVAEQMMNEVAEEEKEMEAKDAQVAKQILREEKDAILAERIMESERMAMAAQAKIEEDDFQKARLLHEEMVGERKREEGEMEGRDRMVARSYEIKDQRTEHREQRQNVWLDKIAALYLWAEDCTGNGEEKKGEEARDLMSMAEFKVCHDHAAWQDASMEIHDVMAGICVSARLPGLDEVAFSVGESGKEVELSCISRRRPHSEVCLIHRNIEAYHGLMHKFRKHVQGAEEDAPEEEGFDIDPISTYSIHLQLDACLGVGVTKKDISYVFDENSGVIFVYLNGLKLRGSAGRERAEAKEEAPAPIKRGSSLFGKMVSMVRGGKK
ncbi:hypothetical protein TeGR_g9315 [Tetraparma gracilis]|uniref:Uncharacterized protein n=1 Tax=Tetraparma gracilis TaxID=2962635 RepID=A0ABQ6MA54_9STRA|nr:hypothetical protein TeGR_g9315 [Tetraparma gracilis]